MLKGQAGFAQERPPAQKLGILHKKEARSSSFFFLVNKSKLNGYASGLAVEFYRYDCLDATACFVAIHLFPERLHGIP